MKVWLFLFVIFAQGAKSKELVLVAGLSKPPYVIPEDNSGFEIDLMRGILATLDHEILVLYVEVACVYFMFCNGFVAVFYL